MEGCIMGQGRVNYILNCCESDGENHIMFNFCNHFAINLGKAMHSPRTILGKYCIVESMLI